MKRKKAVKLRNALLLSFLASILTACFLFEKTGGGTRQGRDVMFVGVDISGSYMNSRHFNDSMNFLAHYLYAHLNGYGELKSMSSLFVGSIGGVKAGEPKTFYPIQTFEHKSVEEILKELKTIFPKNKKNPYTDFNAFFRQVAEFTKSKNLVLRPISIVMVTDGVPDIPGKKGIEAYRSIKLDPLETLSRNVNVRILYTSSPVGMKWRTKVKRQRVRIWTQDGNVMKDWKDKKIFLPKTPFEKQMRFFAWVKDNVDFPVRLRRVD